MGKALMGRALTARLAATGAELDRLAARVRALIAATVASEPPVEALSAATAAVEAAIAALAPFVPATPPPRYPEAGSFPSPNDMMPFDPVIGRLSPLAPPVEFAWEADGRSVGRARFGTPYEGPPGCVHGGVLAAVFDQVLNIASLLSGSAGPTARLALRYRRPTPLFVPLVFEGWVERRAGRQVHARGRCLHGEEVTVEAEAVFVHVPLERVLGLLGQT
jgi:acyl-coenzyme A thioesterase PaaI-like protein